MNYVKDQGLWKVPIGALLFLQAAWSLEMPEPRLTLIIKDTIDFILSRQSGHEFVWNDIETWYVLLYAGSKTGDKEKYNTLQSAFKKILQKATLHMPKLEIRQASFLALLLNHIYHHHALIPALHVSDEILKRVNKVLAGKTIPDIFPFNEKLRAVPLGLSEGVCGTALSLWSLKNNNCKWLSILGVNTEN